MRTREAHMCSKCIATGILSLKSAIGTVTFVKATSMLLVYSEQLHTPQPYTVCVQWRQPLCTLHNVHMWPVLCSLQPSARMEMYMPLLFVYILIIICTFMLQIRKNQRRPLPSTLKLGESQQVGRLYSETGHEW